MAPSAPPFPPRTMPNRVRTTRTPFSSAREASASHAAVTPARKSRPGEAVLVDVFVAPKAVIADGRGADQDRGSRSSSRDGFDEVPGGTTRLSRIRRLFERVQGLKIDVPARLTAASHSGTVSCQGPGRVGSPSRNEIRGAAAVGSLRRRLRMTTSRPSPANREASRLPTKPVPR